MALPASGPISLSQVNVELGLSATAQISLNDAAVRGLFGVASGAISMSDGYGKANVFAFTIAANQTNANLRTLAVNAGWNQSAPVEATINSGVIISGDVQANSTAALTVDGSWPGGVTLINNGSIRGRGGNAGNGAGSNYSGTIFPAASGTTGGRALLVSVPLSLNNAGTIAGGGGGGGGGGLSGRAYDSNGFYSYAGGGGGGGGRSSLTNSSGGTGGVSDSPGSSAGANGGAGTLSAAGSGGFGGQVFDRFTFTWSYGGTGGAGGALGAAGSAGTTGTGGFSASPSGGAAGGAAGQAISGNSNITYIATGTRLGPIV